MRLSRAFVDAVPDPARVQVADLEPALTRLVDRAHVAWPDLAVDPVAFVAHIASGLADSDITGDALAALEIDDLALAFACATGSAEAVTAFEGAYAADLRAILARLDAGDLTADILQRVRERLFVADAGARPGIARYTGRGELLAFVRVTALRVGLDVLRARGARKEISDDELAELPATDTPELAYLKTLYRREFKLAFEAALAGLEPRARTLFRYTVVDRLSIDKLAALYALHRSTMARQIHQARQALVEATRDELAERLRVPREELSSILRLIASDVDLSLERVLQAD